MFIYSIKSMVRKRWIILLILGSLMLMGCQIESEFDTELKTQGLLAEDGTYAYNVPITHFGEPAGTPATAITLTEEVLLLWSGMLGGEDAFVAEVTAGEGLTALILDYTGTITKDKAVFIALGSEIYPQGTLAINMLEHVNDQTGQLARTEYKMSIAHELTHAYDYKHGLEPSAEFERSGAAALSAYSGEIVHENLAETVAAFLIGQGRPVGDSYVFEWLRAYFVNPNLPNGEAVPYNPDEWPRPADG